MTTEVVAIESIRGFFSDALTTALRDHRLSPHPATADYLVDLLCHFLRHAHSDLRRPLGPVMATIDHQEPLQYMKELKRVGDCSLYVTGFFPDNLSHHRIDTGYYYKLGGTAYGRLSRLMRRKDPKLVKVYSELSADFVAFAQALGDLEQRKSNDLVELYERWLRRRSPATAAQLRAAGLNLPTDPDQRN